LPQTYHRLRNRFGHTRWYSKVMRLKWKLDSVCLEIVLVSVKDRCSYMTRLKWKLNLVRLEIVLTLT
jgi:hypothetical protein